MTDESTVALAFRASIPDEIRDRAAAPAQHLPTRVRAGQGRVLVLCTGCDAAARLHAAFDAGWTCTGSIDRCPECTALFDTLTTPAARMFRAEIPQAVRDRASSDPRRESLRQGATVLAGAGLIITTVALGAVAGLLIAAAVIVDLARTTERGDA
jgi:hypothetical protein